MNLLALFLILINVVSCDSTRFIQSNSKSETKSKLIQKEDVPEETNLSKSQKPMLGIRFQKFGPVTQIQGLQGRHGVKVQVVMLGTAADEAGLKDGDLIYEFDGKTFDDIPDDEKESHFREYIASRRIGDEMVLKIYRDHMLVSGYLGNKTFHDAELSDSGVAGALSELSVDQTAKLEVHHQGEFLVKTITLRANPYYARSDVDVDAELLKTISKPDELERVTQKLIDEHHKNAEFEDLLKRYQDDQLWNDGFRLQRMQLVQAQPQKIKVMSELISDQLKKAIEIADSDHWRSFADVVASLLDSNPSQPFKRHAAPKNSVLDEHIEYIEKILQQSMDYRYLAFRQLTADELKFLEDHITMITERSFGYSWTTKASIADFNDFQRVLQLMGKVDFEALMQSGRALNQLMNVQWVQSFKTSIETHLKSSSSQHAQPAILFSKKLKHCLLVVGNADDNVYTETVGCLIDLGGDDEYRNRAGAAFVGQPVSFLIDVAGNDSYSSYDSFSQGSALLGSAFLLDLAGDDHYLATKLTQGAAVAGHALLVDLKGHDVYQAQEYAQGFALWGVGALVDRLGDDLFRGALYVQGVGATKGLGVLFDQTGQDAYQALGLYRSSYGDTGVFSGYSQGFGIGMRTFTSGGLGVMMDGGGRDKYNAGDFSQGGGYYFGYGILRSYGLDNDVYQGSRYAQGFMAHSAVGAFIEDGGHDRYRGRVAAAMGTAWDLGASLFNDKQGNDRYDALGLGFALGSVAHNGFAVFWDQAGKDEYRLGSDNWVHVPGNSYHQGYSFGFLMDFGGDADQYDFSTQRNNTIQLTGEYGFFVDANKLISNNLLNR